MSFFLSPFFSLLLHTISANGTWQAEALWLILLTSHQEVRKTVPPNIYWNSGEETKDEEQQNDKTQSVYNKKAKKEGEKEDEMADRANQG